MSEDDVGFLYKTMIERDPKKRRVKPVETAQASLLDFDLGESSDDSDFRIEDHCEESDDDSVDSNDAGKDDEGEDEESSDSESSLKNAFNVTKNGPDISVEELIEKAGQQNNDKGLTLEEKLSKMVICCGCLGDRSDDVNEIIECDGCGITVHEGCYGVSDVESFSSIDSLSQSAPWFCEACSAGIQDPQCELCPNKGGIFKETDVGKWVHLVCALYVPYVAFGEVDRLTSVTLFEMPYNKWGAKACSICEDINYALTGVCIECDAGMCHTYFHVTCAQREGLLSEAHSEEVDQADPFYAHCKLHSDKALVRKRKRNWLALQLRSRYRQELLQKPEYKNTEEYKRIQRKLAKHRKKYLTNKASKPPPWVPTQKMPRLLTTSASAVRSFHRKAELMGIDTVALSAQETQIASLVDIRKKWHIPPAFTVEFVSYYIDRVSRASSMKKKLEEYLKANAQLLQEQQYLDKKYDEVMKSNEEQISNFETLKAQIEMYHGVLKGLSYNRPLPLIKEIARPKTPPLPVQSIPSIAILKKGVSNNYHLSKNLEASQQNYVNSQRHIQQNHKVESLTVRHQCGICRRATNQHLLAKCDTCGLHYHLSCLTPPLTRMPKKTKLMGWQCSECDKESSSSDKEPVDTSTPRRLRHCKKEGNDSANSVVEDIELQKPPNKVTLLKRPSILQSNDEDVAVVNTLTLPKVTIKPVAPEPMELEVNENKVGYDQSFNNSVMPFREGSPEYRMASPEVPQILSARSGKKRRREKHKRYTPDPITGVKQRKHKHKRKSLDVENSQNEQPEVHRRITIKIKPIPYPDGKEPSETSPQLFVASSTSTDLTPPKTFIKSSKSLTKAMPISMIPAQSSSPLAVPLSSSLISSPTVMSTQSSINISNSRLSTGSSKKKEEVLSDCTVCNLPGTNQNIVLCDDCKRCYHFACLDPPVKKSPKRRGYSWHCADCDPSEPEN